MLSGSAGTALHRKSAASAHHDDGLILPADRATRLLCATVQMDDAVAEDMLDELVRLPYQAICPAWGIDLASVARHAIRSCARRAELDRFLAALLGGLIVLCGLLLVVRLQDLLSLRATTVATLVGTGIVVGLSWEATRRFLRAGQRRAARVADGSEPPQACPADLTVEQELRLAAASDANVVFFTGGNPFAGSGLRLDTWSMTLDISRSATDDRGTRAAGDANTKAAAVVAADSGACHGSEVSGGGGQSALDDVEPFSAVDLHRALIDNVGVGIFPGLEATARLYIRGEAAHLMTELMPEGHVRLGPGARASRELIEHVISCPNEVARAYASFSKKSWGGHLVVSVLVRAALFDKVLFLEGNAHVLLPLGVGFTAVQDVPRDDREQRRAIRRLAIVQTLPFLVGSPGRVLRRQRHTRVLEADCRRIEREIEAHGEVDYGARRSIREAVGLDQHAWYYAIVDEVMHLDVIKQRILDCLRDFLVEHNVSSSQFDQQRANLTQISLHGSTWVTGNNNVTNNVVGSGPPPKPEKPQLS